MLCIALCAAGCSGGISEAQSTATAAEKALTSACTADFEPIETELTEKLSEEELAALKGWWTREGIFYDGINLANISFRSIDDGYEENTWFANGVFGDNRFWSGNMKLTEDGLEGTVKTGIADENFFSEENIGTVEVKIAEEGVYSILLTFGTGEEYHLTLLTELEP